MTRAFYARDDREPLSGRKLRQRALDLLSRRDHSEWELRRKLLEKGGVAEELAPLFRELRDLGYLDDTRYAENFVRFRADKAWGQARYRLELLKRGVGDEIIDQVLASLPEVSSESLSRKLGTLIQKEFRRGRTSQQVVATLLRRGFSGPRIREALAATLAVEEPDSW